MKNVQMIAIRNLYYGGAVKKGKRFFVTEGHARLLTAVGSAKRVDESTEKGQYKRRDMRAEK